MKEGKYGPSYDRIIRICSIILFLLTSFLLVSCTKDEKNHIDTVDTRERDNKPLMKVAEEELIETAGWLSQDEILTIEQDDDGQAVYLHQFNEKEPTELFRTSDAIMSADASTSGEYVAITHSNKSDSATLLIISRDGKKVLSREVISSYVLFEWDNTIDYQERLLVMALKEDWSYDSLLINAETTEETQLSLPKPFIQWIDDEYIAYIGDATETGETVHQYDLEMEEDKVIHEDAVGVFSKYGKTIIATVNEGKSSMILKVYTDGDFGRPVQEIEIPAIAHEGEYLMPYMDVPEDSDSIFILAPLTGEASSLFELFKWDLRSNERERIIDRINNEPIACNADGTYCLYGHLLDSIIDLREKTIEKFSQAEIM